MLHNPDSCQPQQIACLFDHLIGHAAPATKAATIQAECFWWGLGRFFQFSFIDEFELGSVVFSD